MKKRLKYLPLLIGLAVTAFLLVFISVNLWDAPAPDDPYTMEDLPPASLASDNGYHQVMALSYPPEVDITSPEVTAAFNRFSDVALLGQGSKEIRERAEPFMEMNGRLAVQKREWIDGNLGDHFEGIASQRDQIDGFLRANPVLMRRYEHLPRIDKIEDFSLPVVIYPLPDYRAILAAAKGYTAGQILLALDGKWRAGTMGLLREVDFARRLSGGSRWPANKSVSLWVMRLSLDALAFLLNHEECPPDVAALVFETLAPLEESEIGLRNPIIFEFLMAVQGIEEILEGDGNPFQEIGVLQAGFWPSTTDRLNFLARFRIFLNRNRTTRIFLSETRKLLRYEERPPFRWAQDLADLQPPDPTRSPFWWISNPIGKALVAISYPSHQKQIFEKYRTKALFDMVRICAEFHAKTTADTPDTRPGDLLAHLESAKERDPFSGRPYVYDGTKQILYSVGENRVDNGGDGTPDGRGKTPDLVVPCRNGTPTPTEAGDAEEG